MVRRRPAWYRRVITVQVILLTLLLSIDGVLLMEAPMASVGGVASRYITAVGTGDADAVEALVAPRGGTDTIFLGKDALGAMFKAAPVQPRRNVAAGPVTYGAGTASLTVGYEDSNGIHSEHVVLRRIADSHTAVIFPTWKVVLESANLTVSLPYAATPVTIDGVDLPDTMRRPTGFDALILPGTHVIALPPSGPFVATSHTITVKAGDNAGLDFTQVKLSPGALASAKAIVTSAFRTCTTTSSLSLDTSCPRNDPQIFDGPDDVVTWTLAADPAATMTLIPRAAQSRVFTFGGHYVMHAAFAFETTAGHRTIGGAWLADLTWNGAAFTSGDTPLLDGSKIVQLLPQPAVTSPAALQLVRNAIRACAALRVLNAPDCPLHLEGTSGSQVSWRVDGNPLAGATVKPDRNSGLVSVDGALSATVSYLDDFTGEITVVSFDASYVATIEGGGATARVVSVVPQ